MSTWKDHEFQYAKARSHAWATRTPTLAVTLWVSVSPSLQLNDLESAFSNFPVRLTSGNTRSRKCVQCRMDIKSTPHQKKKKKISITIQKYTRVSTSLYDAE